jgi:hypothetical protein
LTRLSPFYIIFVYSGPRLSHADVARHTLVNSHGELRRRAVLIGQLALIRRHCDPLYALKIGHHVL